MLCQMVLFPCVFYTHEGVKWGAGEVCKLIEKSAVRFTREFFNLRKKNYF